ncbi:hypothetical protein CHOED_070 [Vibrio phage CHOED]|uniref:hypothetical protein n=1 Tax=Vibrio phage CHOED TaxID=1458716 RepID=UPI00042E7280|nr:hypothetical protein CHOED_070 [Vibrio phage CHOED]AHK11930.1 hypothetical protein CHOED_070 [Vibrio phage CHOED]
MKRLFQVVNSQGKRPEVIWFEAKQGAKAYRDELNEALGHLEFHVSRGPDNLKSAKPNHRGISGGHRFSRGIL